MRRARKRKPKNRLPRIPPRARLETAVLDGHYELWYCSGVPLDNGYVWVFHGSGRLFQLLDILPPQWFDEDLLPEAWRPPYKEKR